LRAIVSVYDKTGLLDLAQQLTRHGYEILSSAGTAEFLNKHLTGVIKLESLTGFDQVLSGRVKTLHPKIYASILADIDIEQHRVDLENLNVSPVDLVVCNLYPFETKPSVELIDIGGPSMIRAAAKNFKHVAVVTDPEQYPELIEHLKLNNGKTTQEYRLELAKRAFEKIALYDQVIANWFSEIQNSGAAKLPNVINLYLNKIKPDLKYGENPHQEGAIYKEPNKKTWIQSIVQHSGRELSYLNIYDSDAALRLAYEIKELDVQSTAVVIVKHANPTGAAFGNDPVEVFQKALKADELSAFGGICAITSEVDEVLADAIAAGPQMDVILAPSFSDKALSILVARRKATRILSVDKPFIRTLELRSLDGAYLIQEPDFVNVSNHGWQLVTDREASADEIKDAELAYLVCARTTSNAVVLAKGQAVVGVGAGQQSRVDAAEIAIKKAKGNSLGAVAASDAFFPFADAVELLAKAGIKVIVQPGGSLRDNEVIRVANENSLAMYMTKERHFRH
jgi:phosphoribosylaminoimidazolecarboxamide formyltransferase/IMP cyclohydrolase